MTSKHDQPGDAAALRRQAEEIFRGKASLEDLHSLSPEETQQVLHELHVHQIELEMQNEELRRSQVELDAARARYFDLYDLAPVGYCTVSEQGLILESNLTAATLLGVARSALVKQPISRFILKDDQDTYYLHRKQLFETGTPQVCELRIVKNDRTVFWASLAAAAAQEADGAPVYRVVLSDITKRKRAEEATWRAASEYRALADNLPDLLARFDSGLRHIYVNPAAARAGALSAEEYLGKTIAETGVPAPLAAAWDDRLRTVFLTGEPFEVETAFLTPQGPRYFLTNLVPERDEAGYVGSVLSVARDITERKLTEEKIKSQIEELQRWQDVMLGREDRVQELKREVNELCRRLGENVRYGSQEEQ